MIGNTLIAFTNLQKTLSGERGNLISEDHSVLRISDFSLSNEADLGLLKTLANSVVNENLGTCIFTGEISKDIDLEHTSVDDITNDTLTFVIKKLELDKEGFVYFFTKDGFEKALTSYIFFDKAKKVWIADKFHEFSSITTDYLQWGSQNIPSSYEWLGITDPRKIERDVSINADYFVPHDIRPWLLRPNQNIQDSAIFGIWQSIATKNLLLTLPSEVRCSAAEEKVAFRGEKNREVNLTHQTTQQYRDIFPSAHESANWTYSNIQDAEVKHTLLNYHLASEWAGESSWPNKIFLERALASARESYKLHLQGSGKELLKAYGDIKKSLQDDVNKVAENTRGLVANFWRDFAVAAAVLVFNFVTKSSTISPEGIKILYSSVAVFLILSLTITIFTNNRFNQIAQQNRDLWRNRLYSFIDDKNFDDLVNKPIMKSIKIYSWVVLITFILYVIMSSYLIYLSSLVK